MVKAQHFWCCLISQIRSMLFDATAFWLYDNRESLMIDQVLRGGTRRMDRDKNVYDMLEYVDDLWLS